MDRLAEILKQNGISIFGVTDFSDIPKLIQCRAISRIPSSSSSVIICAFPYYSGEFDNRNISRYAALPDYHIVVADILNDIIDLLSAEYPGNYAAFSDNSPIPEVFCAAQSGVGFVGKNGLIITEKYGSYVFLGEIVTDVHFSPTKKSDKSCTGCGKCVAACPTGALLGDKSQCLSAISQKKGALSPSEENALKTNKTVWGCDICQEVCPHNKNIEKTSINAFLSDVEPVLTHENLDRLLESRPFAYRGKAVIERNLNIISFPQT